jgi:DNA adenine methylase
MQYLGGKYKLAKHIAPFIKQALEGREVYIEPFIGGCNVMPLVSARERFGLDVCEPLITLYKALQAGWIPPEIVTEADYYRQKAAPDPLDPLTAFIGFGCSFGGRWFQGYARSITKPTKYSAGGLPKNFARIATRALARKLSACGNVAFECFDFFDIEAAACADSVIYCDPPYAETKGYDYASAGNWDSDRFWAKVKELSDAGAIVLVSEYQAPAFAKILYERPASGDLQRNLGSKERLYYV